MPRAKEQSVFILRTATDWRVWKKRLIGACVLKGYGDVFDTETADTSTAATATSTPAATPPTTTPTTTSTASDSTPEQAANDSAIATAALEAALNSGFLNARESRYTLAERKRMAMARIEQLIDDNLLYVIEDITEPREALEKLHDHLFLRNGTTVGILRFQAWSLRLQWPCSAGTSAVELLHRQFDTIHKGLEAQGRPADNSDKITTVQKAIVGIPDWDPILTRISGELATGIEPHIDTVFSWMRNHEQILTITTASTADKPRRPPRNSDQALLITPPKTPRRGDSGKKTDRPATPRNPCPNCGKKGHWKSDCTEPRKPTGCYVCGDPKHRAASCPQRAQLRTTQEDKVNYASDMESDNERTNTSFVVDSGATAHVVREITYMNPATTRPTARTVTGVNGEHPVKATAEGELHGYPGRAILIPSSPADILSVAQLAKHGWTTVFQSDGTVQLQHADGNAVTGERDPATGLYHLTDTCYAAIATETERRAAADMYKWHCILGHPSDRRLRQACESASPPVDTSRWPAALPPCTTCIQAKQSKAPAAHSNTRKDADSNLKPGERIDFDLIGPMPPTLGGNRHAMRSKDRNTRYQFPPALLKNKSDAATAMAETLDQELTPRGRMCKELHGDLARELTGTEFITMCNERGIRPTFAPAATPQLNGMIERSHRTAVAIARAMCIQAGLDPDKFWGEALTHADFLSNILPSSALDGKTPWEAWHGEKPNITALHIFGTRVLYLDTSNGKFHKRASEGVYLGPAHGVSGGAARIFSLSTRRVRETRDFEVLEPERTVIGPLAQATPVTQQSEPAPDVTAATASVPGAVPPGQPEPSTPDSEHSESEPGDQSDFIPDFTSESEDEGFYEPARIVATRLSANRQPDKHFAANQQPGEHYAANQQPSAPQAANQRQPTHQDGTLPAAPDRKARARARIQRNLEINMNNSAPLPGSRTRSSRNANAPAQGENIHTPAQGEITILLAQQDPQTYAEAMARPDSAQWIEGLCTEIESHEAQKSWSVAKTPPGVKPITSRLVWHLKTDENNNPTRHKVRLVARGFTQRPGIDFNEDAIAAPVISKEGIRVLLAVTAQQGWNIAQYDVKSAYLYAPLQETIYMRPPDGLLDVYSKYITAEERQLLASGQGSLRLNKAIYGLRQSGRCFYEFMVSTLAKCGFKPTAAEPCLLLRSEPTPAVVVMHVDDLLVASPAPLTTLEKHLGSHVQLVPLGTPRHYLGWTIEMTAATAISTPPSCPPATSSSQNSQPYNKTYRGTPTVSSTPWIASTRSSKPTTPTSSESKQNSTPSATSSRKIKIHQRGYIENIVEKYHDGRHVKLTPMAPDTAFTDDKPCDASLYRSIVGGLLFAAVGTRPDIATAVSILCRHFANPTQQHLNAARNIVAYLAGTLEYGIEYGPAKQVTVDLYADASFAPEEHERRSRSGTVVCVNGAPVDWCSSLQALQAHSTAEAEYIAMADGARRARFIHQLLTEMGQHPAGPITLYEDNQTAKRIAEEITTKRSKHIDVKYHFVRTLVATNQIKVEYCSTNVQIADLLTKPLPRQRFSELRDRIMVKGEC